MKEVRSGENTQFSKNTGLYKGGTGRYALLAGGTEGEKFMTKGVVELLGSQSIDPRDKMNAIEQMVQYKAAYHRMRAEEEKKAYTGKIRNFLSSAAAEGTDLSGLDLSEPGHRESGLDLSGISLRGAGMRGARLCGINFSRADFSGADLTGTDFTGADLTGADFTGADLTGCDMSGVKAEGTVFRNTVMKGCAFTGADLSRSDMSGLDLSGKDLSGCTLNGTVLHEARLLSTNFSHAALCRTDFSAADLSGAVLDGADAARAGFERACLRKASLIGADLFAADFSGAAMRYARLDAATPACAAFCRADLTGAGFCRADFVRRRRYGYRDTSAASFVGAKLDGTDFKDADVRLVDFSRENMKTAVNLVVPPPPCPESGAFTGYRMCFADPPDEKELGIPVISALYSPAMRRVIAELRIPEDAERTSFGGSLLCRCSKAEVVRFIQIKQADQDPFWDRLVGLIKQARASSSGREYILKIGETVNAAEYSSDRWDPDAKGIGFYMDMSMIEEVKAYN